MKTIAYFLHMKQRPDRADIKDEWILRVANHPEHQTVQADNRIRRWARIAEADDRYLRVILLEDGETVHNAFFDRNFTRQHS